MKNIFRKNIVVVVGVALVAMLVFVACISTTSAGNVGANRGQIMLISSAEMDASAVHSYNEIISEAQKEGKLNTNAAMEKRVRNVADKLIAQCGAFRQDALMWNWQVNVITSDEVNAWCMPGGKIAVYTNIINALGLTDGELAAVMGHEIAHALREHSREQASQNALTSMGLEIAREKLGLSELGNAALGVAATYTIAMPFSRSHETEADHIGTELMARAGYDPYDAVHIWEKMQALTVSSTPEILSTHPSHASRIKDLTVIAAKVYPLYEAAKK